MKQSAGFVIKSGEQYLLCHATQLLSKPNINDQKWTISKGNLDPGESEISAAIRELKEETDLDILKFYDLDLNMKWFNKYKIKNRMVIVFLIEDKKGILKQQSLKCNSMISNHPDSRFNELLEMDDFTWVTREEAYNMATKSQKHLFAMEYVNELPN